MRMSMARKIFSIVILLLVVAVVILLLGLYSINSLNSAMESLGRQAKRPVHLRNLDKPIVAMVDGYAFGGGLTLVLSSDIVVATEQSQFGAQEINMGFVGNNAALARLVGRQKASERSPCLGARSTRKKPAGCSWSTS